MCVCDYVMSVDRKNTPSRLVGGAIRKALSAVNFTVFPSKALHGVSLTRQNGIIFFCRRRFFSDVAV